jgi:Pyruvate/2-oxoacid:ferredoxin oxidoreductase gamma subunit
VGGQGTLTLAQAVMEVARRSGYQALQSEIHGMSQRGGTVYAFLSVSRGRLLTPAAMEASSHFLLALEPLEALRHLAYLRADALLFVAGEPVRMGPDYPDETALREALGGIPGVRLVDTAGLARTHGFKHAGGMALLGLLARHLPFEPATWHAVLAERFAAHGPPAVARNLRAFDHGLADLAELPDHPDRLAATRRRAVARSEGPAAPLVER